MRKVRPSAGGNALLSPWLHWGAFTLGLSLLSYASPAPAAAFTVLALLLVLPFAVFLRNPVPHPATGGFPGDVPDGRLLLAGLPVLTLAFALRFLLHDRLYVWPNTDEAMNGILAWDLAREWRWRFFWSFGEVPPLLTYGLAFAIRALGLSHATLWAVPAAVSALTVPAAWLAARAVGGRAFALLAASLFAFSYWPMYMGRFCHQGVLLPLWACLLVWTLARHLKAPRPGAGSAAVLGLVAGSGSLLFIGWPPLALLSLGVALGSDLRRRGGGRAAAFLVGSFLLAVLPFVMAVMREGYGSHLRSVSAFNGYFPAGRILLTMLSYPSALLWGPMVDGDAYAAPVGGLLSPLTGALFLLGLAVVLRRRHEPVLRFALAALPVTLLPGLLSMNVQMFRVACAAPFLVFLAAVGAWTLLGTLPARLRPAVAALLVVLVLAGDFALLVRPFVRPWFASGGVFTAVRPLKTPGLCLAHRILSERAEREGAGLVLTSFTPAFNDASLFTGTLGFNAALNPRLDAGSARWVGFVANVHYDGPLKRRFPALASTWLDEGMGVDDGGLAVFTLPVGPGGVSSAERDRWMRWHRAFFEADVAMHRLPDGGPYRGALRPMKPLLDEAGTDRLLTSLYWEKSAHAAFMDRDYGGNASAWSAALAEGLPTAHLRYLLGALLLVRDGGRHEPSLKLLDLAARDPADRTRARDVIASLAEGSR
jgi:hypothetical protein